MTDGKEIVSSSIEHKNEEKSLCLNLKGYPIELKIHYFKNIFPVFYQNKFCHLHGTEFQEMKDSLIHITCEQDPKPILTKVVKNIKPLAQQK